MRTLERILLWVLVGAVILMANQQWYSEQLARHENETELFVLRVFEHHIRTLYLKHDPLTDDGEERF